VIEAFWQEKQQSTTQYIKTMDKEFGGLK